MKRINSLWSPGRAILLDARIVAAVPGPTIAKALGVDSGKRHVERHHAHSARPSTGLWRNVGPYPGVEKVWTQAAGHISVLPYPSRSRQRQLLLHCWIATLSQRFALKHFQD